MLHLLPNCCAQGHGNLDRKPHHHRGHQLQIVEGGIVYDAPRFKHRGLLIDTARHYLPFSVIKQHLDAMAMSKLNVLHWHLVDDQSFPLESRELPMLSQNGAFRKDLIYTTDDVRKVVDYARGKGIRVVPELDTPGHTLSWGRGCPDLLTPCYDCKGDPTGELGPLNPARRQTYAVLWRLLRDVARMFPDAYLHLGGDEVDFSCWESNPEVRGWVAEQGWGQDYTRAENYFMAEVLRLAAGVGKSYIVWQEVFDDGVHLKPDAIVEVWKWWADGPAEAGPGLDVEGGSLNRARKLLSCTLGPTGNDTRCLLHALLPRGWQPQQHGCPGNRTLSGIGRGQTASQTAWASELQRVTKAVRGQIIFRLHYFPWSFVCMDVCWCWLTRLTIRKWLLEFQVAVSGPRAMQSLDMQGYRALLSAPWYLNLGSYAGKDWAVYYQVEPLQGLEDAPEQAALVVGGEACMWGEYVDGSNAVPRTWPRAAAVAERLWSDTSIRDVDNARCRLEEHRCRMVSRGIQAQPLGPGFCAADSAV